jgi:plastocyanin
VTARAFSVVVLVMAAVVAGCGGGDDEAPAATTSTAGSTADAVDIADFAFSPETVTVEAGTDLTFTNADDASHTATADGGEFDTGTLKKGDSGAITLDQPGTYTYFCRFHPFMKGTVEVE